LMACALFCQAAYGKEQETSDPGHDPTTVRTLADEADAHRHRTAFGRLDERTLLRAMVTRSARMPTPNRVQNRRHARNQETRSPLPLKGLDGCAASHVNITLHGPLGHPPALPARRPLYLARSTSPSRRCRRSMPAVSMPAVRSHRRITSRERTATAGALSVCRGVPASRRAGAARHRPPETICRWSAGIRILSRSAVTAG
jgi:hypothetical protein